MRLTRTASLLALLLSTSVWLAPAPAVAARDGGSIFVASPNFPDSTLAIKVKGSPKAGDRVKIRVSGYNLGGPISPGSETTYSFNVSLYVAVRGVVPKCPRALDDMRTEFINNDDKIASLVTDSYVGEGGDFSKTFRYRSGSARKVNFCAYTRWIIDDVVVSSLYHRFPARRR